MDYTPGLLWTILTQGSNDPDEVVDVQVGLGALDIRERVFLARLVQGFTGVEAMREAGLRGNQTRLKREVLWHLAHMINGDER